jgi:hypothetical protein
MSDVRCGHVLEVFRHGAGELRQALRRAVWMLVDRFIGRGRRETEVAEMSTKRGLVPALSATFNSESMSARRAHRAARRRTPRCWFRRQSAPRCRLCDLNAVSPSAPGKMRERLARKLAR